MQRIGLISVCFVVLAATCAVVAQDPTPPSPDSKRDISARRQAIQRELDANHDAVKDLYELLDVTPEDDAQSRAFLNGQIQQFDERCNVLFEELDTIDMHELQQQREKELHVQVQRLESDAKQLRATKHLLPAITREAKAESLRKALEDGSWKILIDDEWSCDRQESDIASAVQLVVEVEKLKAETASLRREVQRLTKLVESLTDRSASPQPILPE